MPQLTLEGAMVDTLPETICFEQFTIDVRRECLRRGAEEASLRPKSFAVLCLLARNPGRLIPKSEFFATLWSGSAVTDDVLVQCICDIRRVLHDDTQQLIKTVPRRGYLFDAAILRQEPRGAAGVGASRDTDVTLANPRSLAATSVDPLLARLDQEFARRLAIAVLPLTNLTGDAEYEYVVDALTENLITDLSRIRDSMVITPNSVFGYKGKSVPMSQVAGDLGVQYVLTGSLQGSRPQFRVSVQLAEAQTGANLWAERFECEGSDIWSWQDQVTRRIAGTLKLGLVELASRKGLRERPEDPDAIDLTMRGLVLFSRFACRADVLKARALFESALRLDPISAQALVGFAGSHVVDLTLLWADDPVGQLYAADAAISSALEIDPQSAEVRYTKGNLLMLHGEHTPAIDEYRLAINLNPSFSHAYSRIGLAKLELGEPAAAFEPVLKALRLNPREFRTSLCYLYLGIAAFHLERDDEAAQWLLKAIATDSRCGLPHAWLAAIYALADSVSNARAELAEFNRLHPGHTIATLRARERSTNPGFLTQRERFYRGLVTAGLARR
jgi:TolB-like protein/DNA-binding winged helix-turn-helix (wHTH) protein/Flp pilus assembly protein TadD